MAKQGKKTDSSRTGNNSSSKSGKKGSSSSGSKKIKNKKKSENQTSWLLIWVTVFSVAVCIAVREFYWYEYAENEVGLMAYNNTKNRIHEVRLVYEQDWNDNVLLPQKLKKQAKEYLYYTLTDSIFSHWYGTRWDFNGTTEKPRKGKIACGYFVTTTLEHCGFNLPRVKLAQQAASVIIKALCHPNSIKKFTEIEDLKSYMDAQENGLYLLGLDTHVGYLWKSDVGLHFVHSSYSGNKQVSREKWNESTVMSKSKVFVVGDLLGSDNLIEAWIKGERLFSE